jgi:hypothetical protein
VKIRLIGFRLSRFLATNMPLGQTLLVTAGLDWVRRDGGEWLAGRRLSDRVLGACSRSGASSVTLRPSRGSRRRSVCSMARFILASLMLRYPLFPCTPKAAWTPRETRKARRGGRLSTLTVAMKKWNKNPFPTVDRFRRCFNRWRLL